MARCAGLQVMHQTYGVFVPKLSAAQECLLFDRSHIIAACSSNGHSTGLGIVYKYIKPALIGARCGIGNSYLNTVRINPAQTELIDTVVAVGIIICLKHAPSGIIPAEFIGIIHVVIRVCINQAAYQGIASKFIKPGRSATGCIGKEIIAPIRICIYLVRKPLAVTFPANRSLGIKQCISVSTP